MSSSHAVYAANHYFEVDSVCDGDVVDPAYSIQAGWTLRPRNHHKLFLERCDCCSYPGIFEISVRFYRTTYRIEAEMLQVRKECFTSKFDFNEHSDRSKLDCERLPLLQFIVPDLGSAKVSPAKK